MATDTPNAFADLHRAVREAVGIRLFTVSVLDKAARLSRRAYTSHPAEYPVTGTKPMGDDGWSRMVIDGGRTFVANRTAEFAPYFPDHPLINALGCHSAVNIPVKDGGQVVGTVNLLDEEGYFTADRLARIEALVTSHRPALLAAIRAVKL